jgi:hypothetical protein
VQLEPVRDTAHRRHVGLSSLCTGDSERGLVVTYGADPVEKRGGSGVYDGMECGLGRRAMQMHACVLSCRGT